MPNDLLKLKRIMNAAHELQKAQPKTPWRQHVANAWLFEKLRKMMQTDVIRFAYVKNDGSTREARGTLCPKYIPFKAQPKGAYENDGEDEPLRFNYYDIDALWWRSFYIDAFIDTLDEPLRKTVKCEFCGKEVPENEARYYEDGGYHVCEDCWKDEFVECERCGERIPRDEAYQGFDGHLCENCHDDLFG